MEFTKIKMRKKAIIISIKGLKLTNKERLLLNPFDDTPVTNDSLISSVDDMRIFLEIDVCQRYTDNIFNVDKSLYSSFLQRAI